MDSYLDFGKATEFVKYNREADNGQIIPESCCILEDNEAAKELFIAKDENCLIAPTSSNSYSNTVCCIFTSNISLESFDDRKSKNKRTFSLEILYCSGYLQGCYKVVKDRLISHLHIVIGTACGVLALQILGIIFAFCLCKAIGNDRDYHYKY